MNRIVRSAARIWILFWILPSAAQTPAAVQIRPEDVLAHLEQTITWYRQVSAMERPAETSSGVLQRDSTEQAAITALQLAFDFARAEAVLIEAQKQPASGETAPASSAGRNLDQASAKAADRVNTIQARIKDLDAAIEKAPQRKGSTLAAQRDELTAELNLAKEVQKTLQSIGAFAGNLGGSTGKARGLSGEIAELQRTVPLAAHRPRTPAASSEGTPQVAPQVAPQVSVSQAPPPPPVFHPETAGVFSLAAELVGLVHVRSQLSDLMANTDALLKAIDKLKVPLTQEVRGSIQTSDKLGDAAASAGPQDLAAGQREMAALSLRFKQLSTALVPLGEQGIAVETAKGNLLALRNSQNHQFNVMARYLMMRGGGMIVAICIILVLSAVWRRLMFRYIRDVRRRGQFLVIRRIVVWCAIGLVIVLGFVSEFGSLATYAGLLTAGLAVALQNVILSVVAYFFLIGRYGVRIGDRVTVEGVTGNVIDIGLVRFYLLEIGSAGADAHATGRVVVFSNSVIFQPSALFKQMPGTNYAWHSLSLTLSPESDPALAEKALSAAVNSVYEEYREKIERQHAEFERSVDIDVAAPHPECRMRLGAGVEFTVRYPVEIQHGSVTDDRMTKALYDAIAGEPQLTLAASGAPKLQEAVP